MNRALLASLLTLFLCACPSGDTTQPAPGGGGTTTEAPKTDAATTPAEAPKTEAAPAEAPKTETAEVQNPWAKFKPGSFAKLKATSTMEVAGNKTTTTTEMKQTLVDINADEATIETETTIPGMPAPTKATAKIPLKGTVTGQVDPNAPKPKEGEEDVTVMGKTFKCKWTEIDSEANGVKTHVKAWVSLDVPGGAVKSVSKMEGTVNGETTMELVEYEAK